MASCDRLVQLLRALAWRLIASGAVDPMQFGSSDNRTVCEIKPDDRTHFAVVARAVALKALVREDRTDVAIELNLIRRRGKRGANEYRDQYRYGSSNL
jgi:hypothetical protein